MNRILKRRLVILLVLGFVFLIIIQFPGRGEEKSYFIVDGKKVEQLPAIELTESKSNLERAVLEGNQMMYDTLDSLEQGSDVIVVGTPLLPFEEREHHVTSYNDGIIQSFYTHTEFKVEKVIKNEGPRPVDETVEFIEPLAIVEEKGAEPKIWAINGYHEVEPNKRYIVFLADNGRGKYGIINSNSGKFSPDLEQAEEIEQIQQYERPLHIKLRQSVFAKYPL